MNALNTQELLDGYVSYATPSDLAAENMEVERAGHVGTSITVTVTVSASVSWTVSWT